MDAVKNTEPFLFNPYLIAVKPFLTKKRDLLANLARDVVGNLVRRSLIDRFSYAIPNTKALKTIAKYSPIIEIGAGKGYWACCLKGLGADVVAYDTFHDHFYCKHCYKETTEWWSHVQKGGPSKIRSHRDRTLFLCWPPIADDMDVKALH